jgi:hypothetical protein
MSTHTDRPRHHWWQHRGHSSTAVLDRDDDLARTDDPDLIDLRTTPDRPMADRPVADRPVADRPATEARADWAPVRDFADDPNSRTARRQQAAAAAAAPTVPVEDRGTVVRDRVETTTPMFPAWGLERLGVMAIGAFLVVLGALTFARGDLNSSWYQPVVHVLSFDHTPIVGAAEVVAGALLLVSSLSSRAAGLAAVVGILMIVAGAIVASGEDPTKYATEDDYGWMLIGLGAGAALFAAPGLGMRRQRVLRDRVESVR